MKDVAVHEPVPALPANTPRVASGGGMRRRVAGFWLNLLFFASRHAPAFVRAVRPVFVWGATRFSRQIRNATAANARRILGANLSNAECLRFARAVTGNFYDFVADVGRAMNWTPQQMLAQVASVEGKERYVAARASLRGAIVVTAHIGSFEIGLAALRQMEERVHVVFRRDAADGFDRIRQAVRQRLGVIEAPVDEGWGLWVRLRDALMANDVAVIQGDRVMPGQKGVRVPFLGSHIMLPAGPVKLAIASGAPIIPIFTTRNREGKICITIEEAIEVNEDADDVDALNRLARVLAKQVSAAPDQWLMLQPAFCEDA